MVEQDRVALVTGGARGIGLACVERLLTDGCRVAVVEVNEKAIVSARERLSGQGERVHFVSGSVADRAAMEAAVREMAARWGRIDVLVNNAAVNRAGGLLSQTDAEWNAVIEVNLTGAFVTSAVIALVMREHGGGAIINIGSIGAAGFGASPAYAASKAGLIGLTRQMARELGPDGITVNIVAPGVTATEWVERNLGPERIAQAAETAPLRRVATPEDIAGTVAFLTSKDARHITGQVISVSGGQWMP